MAVMRSPYVVMAVFYLVALFTILVWPTTDRRSGRWLRAEDLRAITGNAGFAERTRNDDEVSWLVLAAGGDVDPARLALDPERWSFDMRGPFKGRIYNGTTMAIDRLNIRVTCMQHKGRLVREAVYSLTERIEPLTVAAFSFDALRCDSVTTMAWSVDAAYGREVKNVRDARQKVKGQSHGR